MLLAAGFFGGPFRSDDAGASWTWSYAGTDASTGTDFAFDAADPSRAYFASASRLYVSADTGRTWADLAVAHGYADQAHMVREFRAFGAEPPTRLFTPDWYDTTELSRVSGPAKGVRFVQDKVRKSKP